MIPWYISFTKIFFMNICISYVALKTMKWDETKKISKILLTIANVLIALLYSVLRKFIGIEFLNLLYYVIFTLTFSLSINMSILFGMSVTVISTSLALISMFIATVINYSIMTLLNINTVNYNISEYISIGVIQFCLLFLFFRIKRFKDGFAFLQGKNNIKYLNKIGIIISIIIIVISIVLGIYNNSLIRSFFSIILILGGLLMIKWIRSSITKHYKEKMKERTVELQAEQIKEKDKIINNLKEELSNALTINHKYNHRLSAMENAVSKLGEKLEFKEEYASEYAEILDSLKELSSEYKSELYNTSTETKLPKTNIFSIDNLLEYMKTQAIREKIDFNVELHGDINYMIKNIIPKNKLETLIADHVKDAIIAITSSNSTNKNILVKLGIKDKYYELCISDTGIAFEIDTLLKLGLEKTTTHKDSGGSGIGFMTTFETMKECKASLIIEEYPRSDNDYTKSVIIRFDGNNEYKIISYRAEEIKEQNKNRRITIEKYGIMSQMW